MRFLPMRFLRKVFVLLVLLLSFMFLHVSSAVASSNYLPVTTPVVGKGAVYELGVISASFNPYQLKKNDMVIFRLPSGFIWTTAEIQSDRNTALAASQSSADWNNFTVNPDYLIYGTANYGCSAILKK